jgi:hypothetical protein
MKNGQTRKQGTQKCGPIGGNRTRNLEKLIYIRAMAQGRETNIYKRDGASWSN